MVITGLCLPLWSVIPLFKTVMMINLSLHSPKTLLSDGILAWRVYVVWSRRPWLRHMLILGLGSNFGRGIVQTTQIDWADDASVVGITTAALLTMDYAFKFSGFGSLPSLDWGSVERIYKAWVWMAFALNSSMTASILWRIRYLDSSLNISVSEPVLTCLDPGVLGIFAKKELAATQLC
jgi:hypothetical protein